MSRRGIPTVVEMEGQASSLHEGPCTGPEPDINVRVLCKPLGVNDREDRER